ncbi:hypothetical protein LB505_003389 [Fusarium chuoi]|nr:hypothetical protein LB505_003389 [Fusarium chuoi]
MLAGLYPMTFALQRFNIGRVLGGVVVVWAAICMLTAAVTSYQGLYVQRFFLGFVESIIPTGFMCIVSGYYTQSEQSLRQNYGWWVEEMAVYLPPRWIADFSFWTVLLHHAKFACVSLVPHL